MATLKIDENLIRNFKGINPESVFLGENPSTRTTTKISNDIVTMETPAGIKQFRKTQDGLIEITQDVIK